MQQPQAALCNLYARRLHVHANEPNELRRYRAREPGVEADVHANVEHEAALGTCALFPVMDGRDERCDRQRLDQMHVADSP